MTDEEKADEYAKGKAHEHYHFLFEENSGSPVDFAKLCYLDGLAEGRKEKWHEIKYCSQDLPPRSKDNHLHSVIVSNEYGEPIYYDYNIDEWCDMEGDIVSEGYNHWCELPKFEEKNI